MYNYVGRKTQFKDLISTSLVSLIKYESFCFRSSMYILPHSNSAYEDLIVNF